VEVTIIGAGNMGRGIGGRVVAGGHDLVVIDHDPDDARRLAEELDGAGDGSARGGGADEAVRGDVVALAVYYDAARQAVEERGEQLEGKVVVDITNPVDAETFDGLVTPADSSAAEELAKLAPDGARVVKAFNTTFAATLAKGEVAGQQLDVFIAGDDSEAKQAVAELVSSGGLNPIDAGSLRRARELERLGFLHMAVQETLGTNFASAVKIVN